MHVFADPAFQKKEKAEESSHKEAEADGSKKLPYIDINRAPVLTLWVSISLLQCKCNHAEQLETCI